MEQIVKHIKQHIWLLYAIATIAICITKHFLLSADMDFFLTLVMVVVLLIDACRLAARKHLPSASVTPYALIVIVFVNRLYSYDRLKLLIPMLSNVDPLWAAVALILLAIVILLVIRLIPYIGTNGKEMGVTGYKCKPTVDNTVSPTVGQAQVQPQDTTGNKAVMRPLWIFLILIFILGATFLTLHLVIAKVPVEPFNLFDTVTYLLAYSTAILCVIMAVGLTMTVIIELVRFIYSRIWLPRIAGATQNNEAPPLYVFSFIIVAVLFYLSFRISGFTMDDFTETISGGEYLALPLTVLVMITAFCVIVRITHGLILLVMDMDAGKIRSFFSRAAQSVGLNDTILSISKTIVAIVLGTIDLALKFVKFIPDFFENMYYFTFADENEVEDSETKESTS